MLTVALRSTLICGALLLSLMCGSAFGQYPIPADLTDREPNATGPVVRLETLSTVTRTFALDTFPSDRGRCMGLRAIGTSAAHKACGLDPFPLKMAPVHVGSAHPQLGVTGDAVNLMSQFVFGTSVPAVATLKVTGAGVLGGVSILTPKPIPGAGLNYWALGLPLQGQSVDTHPIVIAALSATGAVLDTHTFGPRQLRTLPDCVPDVNHCVATSGDAELARVTAAPARRAGARRRLAVRLTLADALRYRICALPARGASEPVCTQGQTEVPRTKVETSLRLPRHWRAVTRFRLVVTTSRGAQEWTARLRRDGRAVLRTVHHAHAGNHREKTNDIDHGLAGTVEPAHRDDDNVHIFLDSEDQDRRTDLVYDLRSATRKERSGYYEWAHGECRRCSHLDNDWPTRPHNECHYYGLFQAVTSPRQKWETFVDDSHAHHYFCGKE